MPVVCRRETGLRPKAKGDRVKASTRRRLPSSAFVYPRQRKYPINTPKRARAALSYAARADTSGAYRTVERKVNRRYPQISTRHHRAKR